MCRQGKGMTRLNNLNLDIRREHLCILGKQVWRCAQKAGPPPTHAARVQRPPVDGNGEGGLQQGECLRRTLWRQMPDTQARSFAPA